MRRTRPILLTSRQLYELSQIIDYWEDVQLFKVYHETIAKSKGREWKLVEPKGNFRWVEVISSTAGPVSEGQAGPASGSPGPPA